MKYCNNVEDLVIITHKSLSMKYTHKSNMNFKISFILVDQTNILVKHVEYKSGICIETEFINFKFYILDGIIEDLFFFLSKLCKCQNLYEDINLNRTGTFILQFCHIIKVSFMKCYSVKNNPCY